jgi:2-C-methyl-D-erythritol 4-phosphate cytidylyltransferase
MSLTPQNPLFHALIPCAGTGSRAGTSIPKQYQLVAGQPMVMHTLQALARVPQLASGWVILSPGDSFFGPKTGGLRTSGGKLVVAQPAPRACSTA